jgi:hypothetical protein
VPRAPGSSLAVLQEAELDLPRSASWVSTSGCDGRRASRRFPFSCLHKRCFATLSARVESCPKGTSDPYPDLCGNRVSQPRSGGASRRASVDEQRAGAATRKLPRPMATPTRGLDAFEPRLYLSHRQRAKPNVSLVMPPLEARLAGPSDLFSTAEVWRIYSACKVRCGRSQIGSPGRLRARNAVPCGPSAAPACSGPFLPSNPRDLDASWAFDQVGSHFPAKHHALVYRHWADPREPLASSNRLSLKDELLRPRTVPR